MLSSVFLSVDDENVIDSLAEAAAVWLTDDLEL